MGEEPEEEWQNQLRVLSEKTAAIMAPFTVNHHFDKNKVDATSQTAIEDLQRERSLVFERVRQLHKNRTPPQDLLALTRGSAEQMEETGSKILILSPQWIKEVLDIPKSERVNVKIILSAGAKPQLSSGGHDKYGWNELAHPHQNLLQIWLDYFGPHLNEVAWRKYAAQHGPQFNRFSFSISPSRYFEEWEEPFTAHEQTELLMQLNDWLVNYVALSPADAKALIMLD